MSFRFDLRTLPVESQAAALKEHRRLAEEVIDSLASQRMAASSERMAEEGVEPSDPEWDMMVGDLEYEIKYQLPRFFRGPHLLMLWAAYEASVREIAEHIRDLKSSEFSVLVLDDMAGDPLRKAVNYYRHILQFDLYAEEGAWQKIRMLQDLRHVLIHASGRTDRIKPSLLKKLRGWEEAGVGVCTHYDHLTVSKELMASLSEAVTSELKSLTARFHNLADQHSA